MFINVSHATHIKHSIAINGGVIETPTFGIKLNSFFLFGTRVSHNFFINFFPQESHQSKNNRRMRVSICLVWFYHLFVYFLIFSLWNVLDHYKLEHTFKSLVYALIVFTRSLLKLQCLVILPNHWLKCFYYLYRMHCVSYYEILT